jgi:nucleoid-associated protein YgaU
MAGTHHLEPEGHGRRTQIAVVLTVLVVALAIVGVYSATHKSTTTASAKSVAKSIAPAGASKTPAVPVAGTSSPASVAPAPSSTAGSSAAAKVPSLTYVVQPGDNLTVIAAWFHMHGYGELYDANLAVIGSDPDLIHPGQRITISSTGMTTSH